MNESVKFQPVAIKYMMVGFVLFTIDYLTGYVGIVSVILFSMGINAFINEENRHFDKAKKYVLWFAGTYSLYYVLMIFSVLKIYNSSIALLLCNICRAFATINYIYLTHYFTEGILLDAKKAKVNYIKLGLNNPWIILGVFTILDFFTYLRFKQPIPSICAAISIGMALYFCGMLNKAYPIIYKKNE